MASRTVEGTVTTVGDVFTVRRLRSRMPYSLPLGTVADMVCQRLIKAAIFRDRLERAERKKARRS